MPVSVPEKTLEHWCSQYITYRYSSYAALWWPAKGEDIDVGGLPPRPGKAVQLELKTTTVAGSWLHDVKIDLGQLWEYCRRPSGHQPFYVFPQPDWDGLLKDVAAADGREVTELGFSRSGYSWWFAGWMLVLTTQQVATVLSQELKAHGSAKRGTKERLVRFDSKDPSKTAWGPAGRRPSAPKTVSWLNFWNVLEECGRSGWPQLIRLPERATRAQGRYQPRQVATMLRETVETRDYEPLVTLQPDADGNYQVTPDPVGDLGRSGEEEDVGEPGDNRQVVFLDARALLRAR